MDRPCYEITFTGDDVVDILEQIIKWLEGQEHIFVKSIIYSGNLDCVKVIYEGFPDSDPMMRKYWEQNTGRPHPNRELGELVVEVDPR